MRFGGVSLSRRVGRPDRLARIAAVANLGFSVRRSSHCPPPTFIDDLPTLLRITQQYSSQPLNGRRTYSDRNACIGSTRVARRAGIHPARTVTTTTAAALER